jgi:NADH-quinone oxidoreductase subunit J
MATAPPATATRTITARPEGPQRTTSSTEHGSAALRANREEFTGTLAIPSTVPFIGLGWDDVLFLVFATVMIGTALLVVTLRDIIRCGLALMASLGSLAGMFVLLGAPLVAAAEVLVYIGGITVLILFAIMLTQSKAAPTRLVFQTQAIPAAIAALILAIVIAITVTATDWGAVTARLTTATDALARLLFRDYVLPFEVVSVLLLAAVVGGVFLAKREERGEL